MAMDSKEFLAELRQMVEDKHSRKHPIFGMIENGELSKEQLQGFAKQFYLLFPKPFPKPIAAMFSRSPEDPELERMWLDNLMDEATGGDTGTVGHKQMYIKFAGALGIPRDELDSTRPLPETSGLLHWREVLISQRSWLELYTAQGLCLEGTASQRMQRVVHGLTHHYGFSLGTPEIEYWEEHMSADEEHMKVAPYSVLTYATNDDAQHRCREVVRTTLDVFWLVFDGIQRAFVANDPLYAAWRQPAAVRA